MKGTEARGLGCGVWETTEFFLWLYARKRVLVFRKVNLSIAGANGFWILIWKGDGRYFLHKLCQHVFLVILASWSDAICYIVCYFHWTFSITFSEICIKATLYTYRELELEESWFVLYQYINRNFNYVVIFLTGKINT